MSLAKSQQLSCSEIDLISPITSLIVFLKDEILLNQIVSKKSRIKEIFLANNLDPEANYVYDGRPLDTNKTIIELLPINADQLTEVKLFLQAIKLDLESDKNETYFSPILKPFENPFRVLVFSPEEFTTSFKLRLRLPLLGCEKLVLLKSSFSPCSLAHSIQLSK